MLAHQRQPPEQAVFLVETGVFRRLEGIENL
jgi:hypothetical protein